MSEFPVLFVSFPEDTHPCNGIDITASGITLFQWATSGANAQRVAANKDRKEEY